MKNLTTDVLEQLFKHGTINDSEELKQYASHNYFYSFAAEYGYLDLLKWAHDTKSSECECDDRCTICRNAAKGGHLDILIWALTGDRYPWDEYMCQFAALNGHLHSNLISNYIISCISVFISLIN